MAKRKIPKRQADLMEKLNKIIDRKEHLQYQALMKLQEIYNTLPMDELLRAGCKRELIDDEMREQFGTAAIEALLGEWRDTVNEMMETVVEVNRPDTR